MEQVYREMFRSQWSARRVLLPILSVVLLIAVTGACGTGTEIDSTRPEGAPPPAQLEARLPAQAPEGEPAADLPGESKTSDLEREARLERAREELKRLLDGLQAGQGADPPEVLFPMPAESESAREGGETTIALPPALRRLEER